MVWLGKRIKGVEIRVIAPSNTLIKDLEDKALEIQKERDVVKLGLRYGGKPNIGRYSNPSI
jgi:hypothetical protein